MIRRGEIYWVDWSPGRGSEQSGRRPALVIQNDIGNQYSPTTIIAAVSTQAPPKSYPFHVRITPTESGLSADSVIKCEQIITIDKDRLGERIGSIPVARMRDVENALHRSLGLACPDLALSGA